MLYYNIRFSIIGKYLFKFIFNCKVIPELIFRFYFWIKYFILKYTHENKNTSLWNMPVGDIRSDGSRTGFVANRR